MQSNVAGPGLKLLSLVIPTLDIDLENGMRAELCEWAKNPSSEEAKRGLGDPRNLIYVTNTILSHIGLMEKMDISYSKLGIHLQSSRSIYEAYSSSGLSKSNKKSLKHRIENQVLCGFLQRSERPAEEGGADKHTLPTEAKQQYISSYENGLSSGARRKASIAASTTDKPEDSSRVRDSLWRKLKLAASKLQLVPEEHNGPASSLKKKVESMQGIVVAHLWVLMIYTEGKPKMNSPGRFEKASDSSPIEAPDADEKRCPTEGNWTVITAFPERWNAAITPSLQSTIVNALSLKTPTRVGPEGLDVGDFIQQMLTECVNFIEKTIILSEPVMYSIVFGDAIARLVSVISS